MSSDPQAAGPGHAPPEAVVEFGAEPDASRRERRRWGLTEILGGLAADRRAVPLAAAVGGVALFASLISEWQVTALDTDAFAGGTGSGTIRQLPAGVTDLGAIGGAYLVGLFVLAGAVALVLFGAPVARRYARLLGLSTGGVLIALLVALTPSLGETSRVMLTLFTMNMDAEQLQLSYGRGLWCAFFGVAAVVLALYLAGRHEPPPPSDGVDEETVAEAVPAGPVVWSWRRPKEDDEGPPDAPFDLTVTSTKPFTSLDDDRDKPS
ncbi:MAG TPA: hypothetical protein VFH03_24405 [Actinoplanes sp.]|nr:hypothetical protein [Actinoplanes sp.]